MPTKRRMFWPRGTWMRLTSSTTLRALMDQREMSLSRLARYAGVSKGFIAHLRADRKSTCTPAVAQRIAEALDVPLALLFVPSVAMSTVAHSPSKSPASTRVSHRGSAA